MPPSGWHDNARDAGHDDLQNQVVEWAQKNPAFLTKGIPDAKVTSLTVEAPFIMKDRTGRRYIGAFADVLAIVEMPGKPYPNNPQRSSPPERFALIWEIKPKIYSAGSTIRQLKATAFEFWKSEIADYAGDAPVRRMGISVVFPYDDPNRDVLENMLGYCDRISTVPWDMAKGAPRA